MGLWWNDLDDGFVSYSNHHILVEIGGEYEDIEKWFAFGVCGWSDSPNKHKRWQLIRSIQEEARGPLLVFGDFNEILSNGEKEGVS